MAVATVPRALLGAGSVSSALGVERLINSWMRQDPATAELPFVIGIVLTVGGFLILSAAALVWRFGQRQGDSLH